MPAGYIFLTIISLIFISEIKRCRQIKKNTKKLTKVKDDKLRDIQLGYNRCEFINKWFKTSLVVGLFLMYPTVIKKIFYKLLTVP